MRYTIVICFCAGSILLAQGSSGISGTITDAESGEALLGVNVMVKGTYSGATTGIDGSYIITGLSAGTFDLEISYIGYKVVRKTGILLAAGESIVEDIQLETTVLSFGEDVVIIGKKALFDVAETASSVRVSKDDIEAMIVDDMADILSKSAGVSSTDNEVHVRGGRLDETLFIIDGVAVKDPLTGYGTNLFINADAIEEMEILTGGYNAEYGQAMSGVVNVKLKRGNDDLEGSFKYTTDNFGSYQNYGLNRVEFNLGGRTLWDRALEKVGIDLPGKFYSFLVGYGKVSDTHLPSASRLYPHNNFTGTGGISNSTLQSLMDQLAMAEENDWHGMYKLTWQITPRISIASTYDLSININQGFYMPRAFSSTYFPYRYKEILDNYNTITRTATLFSSILSHTLGPRSFYEIKFGQFVSREHSAVQDLNWTDYREHHDLDPTLYNPSSIDGEIQIEYGDRFYDTGVSAEWYDIYSDNKVLKGDWTYHPNEQQKIKVGIETNWTDIQVVDIDDPWTGTTGLGANYDIYQAETANGSFYYQHNLVFEGMILNVGLRYDYWIPGAYLENAVNDTNSVIITDAARDKFYADSNELFGRRYKGYISPRLGISHPVTDNDVLYYYYGHFSQLPTYQYIFAKLNSTSQGAYQIIGNPTLNPKTTVQYEIGVKHRFSADQVLEVKTYWKNMYNYETSQTITSDNPRYAHLRFNMYFNADYARSRGVEAIVRARFWKYFNGDATVNYSITTGKSSTPNDNLLVQAGALREKPLGENYLAWDRPIQAFANLSFYYPDNEETQSSPIRAVGGSLRFDYESGRRFTSQSLIYTDGYDLGRIEGPDGVEYYNGTPNSDTPFDLIAIQPRVYFDARAYKDVTVGTVRLRVFTELENIFDVQVPRRINPFTARGYGKDKDGNEVIYSFALSNSANPNFDPSRFEKPRRIEIGIQVSF